MFQKDTIGKHQKFSVFKKLAALSYTSMGTPGKPALMFLHGFLGSKLDWKPAMTGLARSFYCVSVDLPGHGQSTSLSPEMYTFEGVSRALCDIVTELDRGLFHIIGYSMGGRIGLYTALNNPDLFESILLESAHPGISGEMEKRQRIRIDLNRAERLERSSFLAFLKEWYHMPIFSSLERQEGLQTQLIESRLKNNNPRELARALKGLGTGVQPSLWDRISNSDLTIHFITGELDARYKEIGEQLALRVPTIDVHVVPNAGHNVHLEQPKTFISKLNQLLNTPI